MKVIESRSRSRSQERKRWNVIAPPLRLSERMTTAAATASAITHWRSRANTAIGNFMRHISAPDYTNRRGAIYQMNTVFNALTNQATRVRGWSVLDQKAVLLLLHARQHMLSEVDIVTVYQCVCQSLCLSVPRKNWKMTNLEIDVTWCVDICVWSVSVNHRSDCGNFWPWRLTYDLHSYFCIIWIKTAYNLKTAGWLD